MLHCDPFHFATEFGSRQHHPPIAVAPRDAAARGRDVGDEAADPHLLLCRGVRSVRGVRVCWSWYVGHIVNRLFYLILVIAVEKT